MPNEKLSDIDFKEFFKKATGYEPYPYQENFALNDLPKIINVPTGTGKIL